MELSALENTGRQTQPYTGSSVQNGSRTTDSMFADLLLGIAGPAANEEVADTPIEQDEPRDRDRDDLRTDNDDSRNEGETRPKKPGRAVTADLADPLATPNFGESSDAKAVHGVAKGETGATQFIAEASDQSPSTSPAPVTTQNPAKADTSAATSNLGDATSAETTAVQPGGPASHQAQAAAGAQSAEQKAMAKRAGAIEANQSHKDSVKGQLTGNANAAGNDAKNAGQQTAQDGASAAQTKGAEAGAPTSDIARLEQALRQAFPTPQAASGAAAPGVLAQSPTQTGADALLAARGGEGTVDAASAAANGNNRANAAAADAKNTSARPAFTLPNGRPAEQVSVQIQNGIRNGTDRINIKLTPANLGNVEVKLEMAPDKSVQAIVYADKAETLDMLERDGRVLQKALEDAGLRANPDSLSFQHRDPGQSANAGHDGDRNASSGTGHSDTGNGNADTTSSDIPVQVRRSHDGLIDLEA